MNILILCIFDETYRNKQLIQIQRENFVKNNLIDYYFITYDENLTEEFKLINDTLYKNDAQLPFDNVCMYKLKEKFLLFFYKSNTM